MPSKREKLKSEKEERKKERKKERKGKERKRRQYSGYNPTSCVSPLFLLLFLIFCFLSIFTLHRHLLTKRPDRLYSVLIALIGNIWKTCFITDGVSSFGCYWKPDSDTIHFVLHEGCLVQYASIWNSTLIFCARALFCLYHDNVYFQSQ